ncbi:IclR family transcriptional regulator [Pseudonocardia acaciae]|uniref:IclR family transcriptional regulator n=1 Tax=Pseudonocardia acaciae TaxID=551276 RepID=UPI00048E80BF|nr:IclR family transcriptional regulator [Pseudonocardia acaciae]
MAADRSTSLNRAIAILNVLGASAATGRDGLGVVQIARLVEREKSQVSRTLKTLAEAGFVIRDPVNLRYRLGWRLFVLAAGATRQHLTALAPRVLRRLVAHLGECAHLSVLDGGEVLTVMSESPGKTIQAAEWVGHVSPLHCTSSGRALLFDHTDTDARMLLERPATVAVWRDAPPDVDELLVKLRSARRRGYVVVNEEFEPGLVAAAAPVRDFHGGIVGALNVSAPKFRLGRALDAVGREVRAAADQLSRAVASAPANGENGRRARRTS